MCGVWNLFCFAKMLLYAIMAGMTKEENLHEDR